MLAACIVLQAQRICLATEEPQNGQWRKAITQQKVEACLYVDTAVFYILLLVALGPGEEAQHLVPLALPPLALAAALLRHPDVQPQVCCLSGSQVAQVEVSPAHHCHASVTCFC